jgi:hypothetical protein
VSISGVRSRTNGVQDPFRGGNAAPAESPENARRLSPIAVAPSRGRASWGPYRWFNGGGIVLHGPPASPFVARDLSGRVQKLRGKEAPRFVGPLSCANEFNGSNGLPCGGFVPNPGGVRERSSICPQTP